MVKMGTNSTNGDANSIHRSDRSDTVVNHNSNENTPTPTQLSQFPSVSRKNHAQDPGGVEKDPDQPVNGWPRVAMLMAETPDFAAFSRFRDLNIKSLLYYQAELTKLRLDLHEQELEDSHRGDDNACQYAKRADILINSEGSEQWELVTTIRKVLKEYNEALLLYSQVSALPEPENCNMKSFKMWLQDPNAGHFSIGGNGEENTWGNIYDEPEAPVSLKRQFVKLLWNLVWQQPPPSNDLDLVATRQPHNVDGFTRWVAVDFIPFYANVKNYWKQHVSDVEKVNPPTPTPPSKSTLKKEFQKETLETYSEKGTLKFTSAVSTVVACLLPTVAIIVLSQIQGMTDLLICLAGFTMIFAVGLIFLTSGTATRVEIFTATAAFSAVLVVFISTPPVIVQ